MPQRGGKYWDDWEKQLRQALEEDPYVKEPDAKGPEDVILDLNIVARQILAEICLDRHWSQSDAAEALGLHQRSFGRFMTGAGWSLSSLTRACRWPR